MKEQKRETIRKENKHAHKISCECSSCQEFAKEEGENKPKKKGLYILARVIISFLMLISSLFIDSETIKTGLVIFSSALCGYDLVVNCIMQISKKNVLNENLLMIIASVVAFVIGERLEGALIVILYRLGALLESLAIQSSQKQIDAISKLKIEGVKVITKRGIAESLPNEVVVGSLIQVNKGERVPIDGILLYGVAELDVMAISGESNYLTVKSGDEILSGSINVGESIIVKTTKCFEDSVCQKIVKMVDEAQDKKAKAQRFVSSFAKIYTPIVCGIALLIGGVVPLFDGMNFSKWIYKALSFLVVSCPCALVISVPLAFFIGIGSLAKRGILVKSSIVIENASKITAVAFDKTGTLTRGEFDIVNIETYNGFSVDKVMDYAVTLEKISTHPLAKVISNYKNTDLVVSEGQETVGKGVKGIINGDIVGVGNSRLASDFDVRLNDDEGSLNCVYVYINNLLAGKIILEDKVKENAKNAVKLLKKYQVQKTVMLSGDKKQVAKLVGAEVCIDEVFYGLLPSEKTEKLLEIKKNNHVAFVGDGINDSPSLASADVGFAMGGLGSDIAVESADVVILDDDLEKISLTIKHSRKILRIVKENIFCSIGVKVAVMILSLIIKLPMGIAMFADIGIMLLAVFNSFRCKDKKSNLSLG